MGGRHTNPSVFRSAVLLVVGGIYCHSFPLVYATVSACRDKPAGVNAYGVFMERLL